MILFTAGDVGGVRALLPVIQECDSRRLSFFVLDHGDISHECPSPWPKVSLPNDLTSATFSAWLADLKISVLVFGSSVHDTIPLTMARQAQAHGLAVVHVLDNWSNYRRRLEHDGLPVLIPEIYTVMDEMACAGAVADGIPLERIRITGQPALASLADEISSLPNGQKEHEPFQLLFISEPVEADQGPGPESSDFRGYTEKTVLLLLCQALQPHANQIILTVLPHPREKRDGLEDIWQAARGVLRGEILTSQNGRRNVLAADGVIGMASILLYEAWLVGKPVLSLQPGLKTLSLRMLAQRADICFVDEKDKIATGVDSWMQSLRHWKNRPRSDLLRHQGAAVQICDLLDDLISNRDLKKH